MSITARLQRFSAPTLETLRAAPRLVGDMTGPAEGVVEVDGLTYTCPVFILDAIRVLPTARRRLRALRHNQNRGTLRPFTQPLRHAARLRRPRSAPLNVGTEWRLVRKALGPMGDVALGGGRPIGPNLGYGRARWLGPSEVRSISRVLSRQNIESCRARARSLVPVSEEDRRLTVVATASGCRRVVGYFARAALRGEAILFWLT